jgi:hypothetical protein
VQPNRTYSSCFCVGFATFPVKCYIDIDIKFIFVGRQEEIILRLCIVIRFIGK